MVAAAITTNSSVVKIVAPTAAADDDGNWVGVVALGTVGGDLGVAEGGTTNGTASVVVLS
jgi:hypothetical protein